MENILNNFPEPNRDLPSSYPLPNWFDKEKNRRIFNGACFILLDSIVTRCQDSDSDSDLNSERAGEFSPLSYSLYVLAGYLLALLLPRVSVNSSGQRVRSCVCVWVCVFMCFLCSFFFFSLRAFRLSSYWLACFQRHFVTAHRTLEEEDFCYISFVSVSSAPPPLLFLSRCLVVCVADLLLVLWKSVDFLST